MSLRTLTTASALAFLLVGPASVASAAPNQAASRVVAPRPATLAAAAPARSFSLPTPQRDAPIPEEPSPPTRFAVTLNPLSFVIGRYGANAEFVLAPHHAIIASGYVQTFSKALFRVLAPSAELGETPASRLGGELGYRFYTGRDGPTGLFIGPSLIATPIAYPRVSDDLRVGVISFNAYGGALDVGVQAVIGPGFTIGGGLGVMALAYAPPASVAPQGVSLPSYPEPHVLPRLLMMAGWAF